MQAPESKFAFVVIAARRARQLQVGAPPLLDLPRARKSTRIAMEELQKGLLEFEMPESLRDPAEREEKRRK
jgi:DNA-directed RNA polymerase omega subunit